VSGRSGSKNFKKEKTSRIDTHNSIFKVIKDTAMQPTSRSGRKLSIVAPF
jgi:hypothetical protein